MESSLAAWLSARGLPAWLCPDALLLAGLAGFLGGFLVLRAAARQGARVDLEARALALAFVAAFSGGFLFEAACALPDVVATRSLEPALGAGADTFAALLAGSAAPALYLRLRGRPVAAYLDRSTLLWGVTIASTRLGCFLGGCGFGRPTSGLFGVRFPAGSPAAEAHAALGWVRPGAASLPVHPTQLYEAALGLVALALAWRWVRPRLGAGAVFAAWMGTYSAGRLALEFLRADASRALVPGLTGGQLASIGVLALLAASLPLLRVRRIRHRIIAPLAALGLALAPSSALAQAPQAPHGPAATGQVAPAPLPDPGLDSGPDAGTGRAQYGKKTALRVALGPAFVLGFPHLIDAGGFMEIDLLRRLRVGRSVRVDLGLQFRAYGDVDATHWKVGLPIELVPELGPSFELPISIAPGFTQVVFDSPHFDGASAFDIRAQVGVQYAPNPWLSLGFSTFAFDFIVAEALGGTIVTVEPRAWAGYVF